MLKQTREYIGLTQLDVACKMDFGHAGTVSQIERGQTKLPPHYLRSWAEMLRIDPPVFAKQYMFYNEPDTYECLYGENPFDLQELPRSEPPVKGRRQRKAEPKVKPLPAPVEQVFYERIYGPTDYRDTQ
jgi:transcriptional regulator with XRE-family HTH domain